MDKTEQRLRKCKTIIKWGSPPKKEKKGKKGKGKEKDKKKEKERKKEGEKGKEGGEEDDVGYPLNGICDPKICDFRGNNALDYASLTTDDWLRL